MEFTDPAVTDEKIDATLTLGTSGLKRHGGIIDEEFLSRLKGQNAIRVYEEIHSNSPIIAAALNIIKMLIKQVDWRIEPADESDEAKIEAEDTESALEDMSHTFEDFISEVLSMLWAGYSAFEIVYKIRRGPDQRDSSLRSKFNDGKFGWRKVDIRSQDTICRWAFDYEGGIRGLVQNDMYRPDSQEIFIPIEKLLLFRTETLKGNPEGRSMLRPAVIPYYFTKRIQEFEAIGVERNLAGMPIMQVPPEMLSAKATADVRANRKQYEDFITQIRMDERWGGLIPAEMGKDGMPTGYKLTFASPSTGSKVMDTDTIIKRYRGEMLMLFMAQFLVMGTEKVGSFSLASNMTDLFATALGTTMKSIASVINRFLIPRRQRLNGIDQSLDPYITHGDIEGRDLAKVGAYIQQLMASGAIMPNEALERELLSIGDLPQPPEPEIQPDALSEEIVESVGNSLSGEQIRVILDVNAALKAGTLDYETALATVAAGLAIDVKRAADYVTAKKDDDNGNNLSTTGTVKPDNQIGDNGTNAGPKGPTGNGDNNNGPGSDIGGPDDSSTNTASGTKLPKGDS